MSLGKLLVAGKSVINGRAQIAYRENARVYLPKFGPSKNPFKSAPEAEAPKTAAEMTAAPVKNEIAVKTQKMPVLSEAPSPAANWAGRLNPISMLRGSRAEMKGAPLPVVQAELSLESVKVVHNDLTDADVEIVPIKSRPAQEMAPSDSSPAKKSWEFLGKQLLKVTAI
jgi:hypothetical protein